MHLQHLNVSSLTGITKISLQLVETETKSGICIHFFFTHLPQQNITQSQQKLVPQQPVSFTHSLKLVKPFFCGTYHIHMQGLTYHERVPLPFGTRRKKGWSTTAADEITLSCSMILISAKFSSLVYNFLPSTRFQALLSIQPFSPAHRLANLTRSTYQHYPSCKAILNK